MKKVILALILIVSYIFTGTSAASAYVDIRLTHAEDAAKLGYITNKEAKVFETEWNNMAANDLGDMPIVNYYRLNLLDLVSISKNSYNLNKTLTRGEAIKIIIRLMGKEEEANRGDYKNPYTDIPDNAKGYVGYAYKVGLIAKTKNKKLGFNSAINYEEYTSMLLVVLGYKPKTDFTSKTVEEKAIELGLSRKSFNHKSFLRADMADLTYDVLQAPKKDTIQRLKYYLSDLGVLNSDSIEYLDEQNYDYKFRGKQDIWTEVMFKYGKQYYFIEYEDSRNMPIAIQNRAYEWPGSKIQLDYSGNIEIKDVGQSEEFNNTLIKDILTDLKIPDYQIAIAMEDINKEGSAVCYEYEKFVVQIDKNNDEIELSFYIAR